MFKKYFQFVSGTAFIFAVLLAPDVAIAADLKIECVTSGGGISCETTPAGTPLFNEKNLAPGGIVVREMEVKNSHGEACVFEVKTKNEEVGKLNLADMLFTVIRDTGDLYGVSDGSGATSDKTMSDVFAEGSIPLGTLAANSTTSFEWAVTFDVNAGNDWQRTETKFDFDMVFMCEEGSGGGDEEDCCPGPDPTAGGAVLGAISDGPSGVIAGALFSKFPVAGEVGTAMWLAKDGVDWLRIMSGALAVFLVLYLVFIFKQQKTRAK